MTERYTKLFSLPQNLYLEGAPLVISAGVLLKDNETGKILVQLKLKNIADKNIKAVKLSISPSDTVGNKLTEDVKFEYLDQDASRGSEFGQKTPICLPDEKSRMFSVTVNEVIFADNSIIPLSGEWTALKQPELLYDTLMQEASSAVGAEEVDGLLATDLVKQYRIDYCNSGRYTPAEERGIWICSCGDINSQKCTCSSCGTELSTLRNFNPTHLVENTRARLAKETAAAKERSAKIIKTSVITAAALVVVIIISLVISSYSKKTERYNDAVNYLNKDISNWYKEEYTEAVNTLVELGNFKGSHDFLIEKATEMVNSGYITDGIDVFKAIGEYDDIATDVIYKKAEEYFESNEFSLAEAAYSALGNYSDSVKKAEESDVYALIFEYDYSFYSKKLTPLNADELKELLPDSTWYQRDGKSIALLTFNADGSAIYMKRDGSEFVADDYYKGAAWSVNEEGALNIKYTTKYGSEHSDKNEVKKYSDDVLFLSKDSVLIRQGSDWAKKLEQLYNY